MKVCDRLETDAQARPSAVRRLHNAQQELRRAKGLLRASAQTPGQPSAEDRVSACSAMVSAREEWLHWIDNRCSAHPEADGDWARQPAPASSSPREFPPLGVPARARRPVAG